MSFEHDVRAEGFPLYLVWFFHTVYFKSVFYSFDVGTVVEVGLIYDYAV